MKKAFIADPNPLVQLFLRRFPVLPDELRLRVALAVIEGNLPTKFIL